MTPLQFIEEDWEEEIRKRVGFSSNESREACILYIHYLLQLERERVRGIIKEKLPVLWSDNVNRHLENVAKHNALSDVLTALTETT